MSTTTHQILTTYMHFFRLLLLWARASTRAYRAFQLNDKQHQIYSIVVGFFFRFLQENVEMKNIFQKIYIYLQYRHHLLIYSIRWIFSFEMKRVEMKTLPYNCLSMPYGLECQGNFLCHTAPNKHYARLNIQKKNNNRMCYDRFSIITLKTQEFHP